jgi:hypothetical protein
MGDPAESRPESVEEGLALLGHHFFGSEDPADRYLRADSFRENVIRLIVFDMHLAIEELVRALVFDVLSLRSERREETAYYVKGLSSRQVLDLAVQLGVIDDPVYERLRDLNTLRNKAAHQWELTEPLAHRSGTVSEPYLLSWQGERLTPEVVKDEFLGVYGAIYATLLGTWRKAHPGEAGAERREA